jgi:hypothetical protein
LLVVFIGTAAIMATGAFGVIVNLRRVPDLKADEAKLVADIQRNTPQAADHDFLLAEIAETKDRKNAIAELWRSRIPWSQKLAEMAEMTPNFIGFTQVRLEEPRGSVARGGTPDGGKLSIESLAAGSDHKRVANFRRIVQGLYRVEKSSDPWVGKRFYSSFLDVLPTATDKVEVRDYVETEALKFKLELLLKPEGDRQQEALTAYVEGEAASVVTNTPVPAAPKMTAPPAAATDDTQPVSLDDPSAVEKLTDNVEKGAKPETAVDQTNNSTVEQGQ